MSLVEFLYVPCGISLCPLWNFFMSLVEFLYVPCGISLCPLSLESLDFTGFFDPCNQEA